MCDTDESIVTDSCPHDLAERENACGDGMCPLCLAVELEAVKKDREHWLANHDSVVRKYRRSRDIAKEIQAELERELAAARAEITRLKEAGHA